MGPAKIGEKSHFFSLLVPMNLSDELFSHLEFLCWLGFMSFYYIVCVLVITFLSICAGAPKLTVDLITPELSKNVTSIQFISTRAWWLRTWTWILPCYQCHYVISMYLNSAECGSDVYSMFVLLLGKMSA